MTNLPNPKSAALAQYERKSKLLALGVAANSNSACKQYSKFSCQAYACTQTNFGSRD